MANLPKIRSITQPSKEFREKLKSRTGINNWANDSAARTVSDTISAALVNNQNETIEAFNAIQITTATGSNLDEIAKSHGMSRLQPTKAYSEALERSVSFYVPTGSFGDLNSGNDYILPKGTRLFPNNATQNSILYETVREYVLPAVLSEYHCGVRAVSFGSTQNVGPRTLLAHSLDESGLFCSNTYAIVNGRGRETDEALRLRLSTYFRSLAQNNQSNLILSALSVPGVLDLVVTEGYFGMGTCGVFVFGADGFSSTSLIRQVQLRADMLRTSGLKVIVSPGVQAAFSFDIEVSLDHTPTVAESAFIRSSIERSIRNYFSVGGRKKSIDLRVIRNKIMQDNPKLLSILPKRSRTDVSLFKNVYLVRKYATLNTGSMKETITKNTYSLEPEEYAILGFANIEIKVNM